MLALRSALAIVVVIAIGCAPSAPTASSPTTSGVAASPTTSPSPTASANLPARFQGSGAPLPAAAGAYVLFQLPSETGLHATSFGGEVSGLIAGQAPQTTAGASWLQSPYGAPFLIGTIAYDRDGKELGTLPWPATATKTWSSDGRFLCAAVPASATTGAQMRLEMVVVGQPAKVVATGFTTYVDNATYPVLACDQGADRAIVGVFGQGVAAARLYVLRLSSGALIRSVDYAAAGGWVAASADGSMLSESVPPVAPATNWKTTIRSADNGAQLGTIDDLLVRGFSGDKTFVVGNTPSAAAVVDWKTGRKVWTASGPYGGYLAEPAGRRFAVGVGFVAGSDQRDVYLVGENGFIALLPERVRVSLRY